MKPYAAKPIRCLLGGGDREEKANYLLRSGNVFLAGEVASERGDVARQPGHVSILMTVGDDFGSSAVGMKGTLRFPFP